VIYINSTLAWKLRPVNWQTTIYAQFQGVERDVQGDQFVSILQSTNVLNSRELSAILAWLDQFVLRTG
jgi:hypothetical protein